MLPENDLNCEIEVLILVLITTIKLKKLLFFRDIIQFFTKISDFEDFNHCYLY